MATVVRPATAPSAPAPWQRVLRRARLWLSLHRRISMGLARRLQLLAEAASDSWAQAADPPGSPAPQSPRDLVVRLRPFGAVFAVRGGTDDLYNVLPFREEDVHHAILGPLQPGDVLVDAGANIGYYAVLGGLRVGAQGHVLAVEAVPSTAAQLRRNATLNGLGNVDIAECAVTDRTSDTVRVMAPFGRFGVARVVAAEDSSPAWVVRGETLDGLCRAFSRIRVLKLDIEGCELAALRGAAETLERTERVVVECNQDRPEIELLLARAGFKVTSLRFATYVLATR